MDDDIEHRLNRKSGFKFPAIDAKYEVRLLQVWRNSLPGNDTITYSLKKVRIEDLADTRYRALSYIWGHARTPNDVREILLDDQAFFVRKNLHNFLSTLVPRGKFGLFFIDAICINQSDHAERQSQVQEMARIFRGADEVIAWLGYPSRDQAYNLRGLSQNRGKDCVDWTAGQWEAFRYLSYNPYWSRVWVLQEVVLASHLVIWCGFFVFSASLFRRASRALQQQPSGVKYSDYGRPSATMSPELLLHSPAERMMAHRSRQVIGPGRDTLAQGTKMGTLDEMKRDLRSPTTVTKSYQSPVPDQLYQVITKFGKLNCSDPKDKLYGFIGLLNKKSRALITPDYDKDDRYAYHLALKIGLQELYLERGGVAFIHHPHGSADGGYLEYYYNVRDAFGIPDDESALILRQVLGELRFQGKLEDDISKVQFQQQFAWSDADMGVFPDFKMLLKYAAPEEAGAEENTLHRFHQSQQRAAQNIVARIGCVTVYRDTGGGNDCTTHQSVLEILEYT